MAARKKKKVVKKQSLNEFRAWLEGVEELQDDDWAPNKEQWSKIRARIDDIEERAPSAVAPTTPPTLPIAPPNATVPVPVHTNIPGVMPAPQIPSSIPVPPSDVEMSPAAKALLGGSPKTPDSASGEDSSFA